MRTEFVTYVTLLCAPTSDAVGKVPLFITLATVIDRVSTSGSSQLRRFYACVTPAAVTHLVA